MKARILEPRAEIVQVEENPEGERVGFNDVCGGGIIEKAALGFFEVAEHEPSEADAIEGGGGDQGGFGPGVFPKVAVGLVIFQTPLPAGERVVIGGITELVVAITRDMEFILSGAALAVVEEGGMVGPAIEEGGKVGLIAAATAFPRDDAGGLVCDVCESGCFEHGPMRMVDVKGREEMLGSAEETEGDKGFDVAAEGGDFNAAAAGAQGFGDGFEVFVAGGEGSGCVGCNGQ